MDASASAVQVRTPQSIGDVEQLVKQLYQPGNSPSLVTQISAQLQQVQLSSEGWQVADALLESNDSSVQFFGALTFTVKLNNDGASLDAAAANSVLSRLISWVVRLSHESSAVVSKKLCSTLTTYFVRSPVAWERPLRQLMLSLQHGGAISGEDAVESKTPVRDILISLDNARTKILLWFATTLADEVSRLDARPQANARAQDLMETIVKDASALIEYALAPDPSEDAVAIRAEALRCFLAWVYYAQPVWPSLPEVLQYLRDLIDPVAACIIDPILQKDCLDTLRDILENYTSFFQPQHMQLLGKAIYTQVRPPLLKALSELDPESLPYGQMVIAYGIANVQDVVEHPEDVYGSRTIIDLHFAILKARGYPGDEDELSADSTEFWNTYVEFVIEGRDGGPDPAWMTSAKQVLSQLVELLWNKMLTPPPEVSSGWSDEENDGFRTFRLDARDLIMSIHQCLGRSMLEQIVRLILGSLETRDYRGVEAALFCLDALADTILEPSSDLSASISTDDDLLYAVFSSGLFREVADFSLPISATIRRTAMDIIGHYGSYIGHHAEFLPDAVRFLFASLDTSLCNVAAKSIAALTSECRQKLTGELAGFINQYKELPWDTIQESYAKEKVIEGIACIIQALPTDNDKVEPLTQLLDTVEQDIQKAQEYAKTNQTELMEHHGISALKCLANIGKGMQVPDDIPVDLDKQQEGSNFWQTGPGGGVQGRIINCFAVLNILSSNGEAIESACEVLRAGYAETEPGPFVLPPSITVSFLQQCSVTTPQLEAVISAAQTLITQHSRTNTEAIHTEVVAIFRHIGGFILQLGQASQDPGVAAGCIEIILKMCGRYAHVLFANESPTYDLLKPTLDFTLNAIEGPDIFPKRAALQFWTNIVKPKTPFTGEVKATIEQIIPLYGGKLAEILMRQVGGLAQRSQVDNICEPLRALLTAVPTSKAWFETALTSEAFTNLNAQVDDTTKRRFLEKMFATRGDLRKLKDVVQEFFAECRGTVKSYAAA